MNMTDAPMHSKGSSGVEIKKFQEVLKVPIGAGILKDEMGNFGNQTEKAVTQFQITNGLPATGIIEEVTRGKLITAYQEMK